MRRPVLVAFIVAALAWVGFFIVIAGLISSDKRFYVIAVVFLGTACILALLNSGPGLWPRQ